MFHASSYLFRWLQMLFCGAVLMLAGCAAEEASRQEEPSSDGTQLTIVTRAMSDADDIDNYIRELRVIAVKDGEAYNVCLNEYFERTSDDRFVSRNGYEAEVSATDNNTLILHVPLNSHGTGIYTFYLIANEDGYIQPGFSYDKTLTSTLADVTPAIPATEVEATLGTSALWAKYAGSLRKATSRYMLMSATERYMVYAGRENNIGTIELVRTMARVDFLIENNVQGSNLTFSSVKVVGESPDEICVMQPDTFTPESENTGETVVAATATAGKAVTFYLPERILAEADETQKDKALQISFTAKDGYGREKTYTNQIYIGPYGGNSSAAGSYAGYSIKRNTYYTITARLNSWSELPYIETTVKPWTYKTYQETFDMYYTVSVEMPATGVGSETSGYVFSSDDAVLTFKVTDIRPDGAECTAELDPSFDLITGVTPGAGTSFEIMPVKIGTNQYTFTVKPGTETDGKAHVFALFLTVNGDRYPIHQCSVKYNKPAS